MLGRRERDAGAGAPTAPVAPGAAEVIRFRPGVEPLSEEITTAIEANLPS